MKVCRGICTNRKESGITSGPPGCAWMDYTQLKPWPSLLLTSDAFSSKKPSLLESVKRICCSCFLMNFLNTCQDAHNKKCYESHFLNGLRLNLILMAWSKLKTFVLLNCSSSFYSWRPLGPAVVIHSLLVLNRYILFLIIVLVIKVIYNLDFPVWSEIWQLQTLGYSAPSIKQTINSST